ncbi:Actin-like protein arp9 (SWI/SNF complex component arp9), partial [Gonapodya sp. JEL0774]
MSFWPREDNVLAIDIGSYSVKFGKAVNLDKLPQEIRSRVGRRRKPNTADDADVPTNPATGDDTIALDSFVPSTGDSAFELLVGEELDIVLADHSSPEPPPTVTPIISHGRVKDWLALAHLLRHVIFDLCDCDPNRNDHPVVVSVPAFWSIESMQRLTQILFEECSVPGFYLVEQSIAAVYAMGVVSGLVLDVGHEVTTVCAVIDNEPHLPSLVSLPIGGSRVDQALLDILRSDANFRAAL